MFRALDYDGLKLFVYILHVYMCAYMYVCIILYYTLYDVHNTLYLIFHVFVLIHTLYYCTNV